MNLTIFNICKEESHEGSNLLYRQSKDKVNLVKHNNIYNNTDNNKKIDAIDEGLHHSAQ